MNKARFDCTTKAGVRDALTRTHRRAEELFHMAEDALLIVGEKVAEYADTRSVADLFSCSGGLCGVSIRWWRAHAVILKVHAQRLYKKAMWANLGLPPYTRRIDAGVSDPYGNISSPPLHPRDYYGFEKDHVHPSDSIATHEVPWQTTSCAALWSRVLIARVQFEYLAWLLHPIPGFRVRLVKQRPNTFYGTMSLYTWQVSIPGRQGSMLHNCEFDTLWQFPYAYPFNPPQIKFEPSIPHLNLDRSGVVTTQLLEDSSELAQQRWGDEEVAWHPGYTNRDLMLHLQDFLVNVDEDQMIWNDERVIDEHGNLRVDDASRLTYATRLRDSGRLVIRTPEPFGHRAVPHVVLNPITPSDSQRLAQLLTGPRALDHTICPRAFSSAKYP